jgi:hypothetical protein
MGEEVIKSIVVILTAIIGVAFIAVLVSRNSDTAGVITSGGNAFARALGAATAPVTAGQSSAYGFPGFTRPAGLGDIYNV